jgi:ABC-2 type transport system ATP-binding protein
MLEEIVTEGQVQQGAPSAASPAPAATAAATARKSPDGAMVWVDGVTKTYGATVAVDNVSFSVRAGEVVGFLGPNGAGKTTSMKIITGYLAPTRGRVVVAGRDVLDDPLYTKARIGYLPENNPLYREMVVWDYLEYVAEMREVPPDARRKRMARMADVCGLGDVLGKYIGELSKGFRQRVGLAQAMMHDPEVLILDEPTAGLDPNQVFEMRALVRDLGKAKTVILSTHNLAEVEATCSRAIIIARGRVVKDATIADLQQGLAAARGADAGAAVAAGGTAPRYQVLMEPEADGGAAPDTLRAALAKIPGAAGVKAGTPEGRALAFIVDGAPGTDLRRAIFALAVQHKAALLELHAEEAKLEDIFHSLTTKD